jgi:hypothetical protein
MDLSTLKFEHRLDEAPDRLGVLGGEMVLLVLDYRAMWISSKRTESKHVQSQECTRGLNWWQLESADSRIPWVGYDSPRSGEKSENSMG